MERLAASESVCVEFLAFTISIASSKLASALYIYEVVVFKLILKLVQYYPVVTTMSSQFCRCLSSPYFVVNPSIDLRVSGCYKNVSGT